MGGVSVVVGAWISPWVLALTALGMLLALPRVPPRLVGAFAVGFASVFLLMAVSWSRGWNCASEVAGEMVVHDCARPPTDAG